MRGLAVAVLLLVGVTLAAAQCDFQAEIEGIALDSYDVSPTPDNRCLIGVEGENCIQGTGKRDLIRFTTLIRNVGSDDCIVGEVPACPAPGVVPPDQGPFHFATCHKHWHLQNYADYYLTKPIQNWRAQGLSDQCSAVPECAANDNNCRTLSGHKTGFCLMDSLCGQGRPEDQQREKYTCSYQGITAGCLDAYVADLPCQWIDVTDMRARWNEEMCLCVTVNANPMSLGRDSNIAGEINKSNNRMCTPITISQLQRFVPQNQTYVSSSDYLTPQNQCMDWDKGFAPARESAFSRASLGGGLTNPAADLVRRKFQARKRQEEAQRIQVAMKRAAARHYMQHRRHASQAP